MKVTSLVFLAIVGKLLIWTIQQFPYRPKIDFIEKLVSCDFCLGVWVYTVLNFVFKVNLIYEFFDIIGLNEIITGIIVSFVMHLISIGWQMKFTETIVVPAGEESYFDK